MDAGSIETRFIFREQGNRYASRGMWSLYIGKHKIVYR